MKRFVADVLLSQLTVAMVDRSTHADQQHQSIRRRNCCVYLERRIGLYRVGCGSQQTAISIGDDISQCFVSCLLRRKPRTSSWAFLRLERSCLQ